jgi:hypothetical protein
MAIAYKLLQKKRMMLITAYLCSKKNKWAKRKKHLKLRRLCRKPRTIWVANGRTDQWWTNLLREDIPPDTWKKNLRMSKECFYNLVAQLDPVIRPKPNSPNYRFLTTDKKLAVTLYYLKDTGSLWMTANTFGIHQSTVTNVLTEVCSAINRVLGPKYIHIPRNKDEMRQKASEFELKFGMIQAIGCIDGTHIAIKRPPDNSQDFFNYKQFFLSMSKLCVTAMGSSWMWNAGGLAQCMMPRFLQIPPFVKTLTVDSYLSHTSQCSLVMMQYQIILLGILPTP